MNIDQYKQAQELEKKRQQINRELKLWQDEIIYPSRLAYCQAWNNGHAAKLETNMSQELFAGFRASVIDNLKVQLSGIDAAFSGI